MEPRPEYQAPLYKGSGKLEGKVALITGRRLGHRPRGGGALRPRGRGRGDRAPPRGTTDADETTRAVEGEGRRALSIPSDVRDPGFAARPSSGPSASAGSWMCW